MNTDRIKNIIACHEAGHMVIAESYGLDVSTLELSKDYFKLKFDMTSLDTKAKACITLAGYIISKINEEDESNCIETISKTDQLKAGLYLEKLEDVTLQDLELDIVYRLDMKKLKEYKNKIMILLNLNLVPFLDRSVLDFSQ
jgi:hypothetical protein